MTTPTVPPAPPPPPSSGTPPQTATTQRPSVFFDWIRDAGIVRTRGWLGGVAAGLSVRTGVDAALIRGILVVLTVLGFPAILLYAVLWLLLPDDKDTIALQQLLRGRFQAQLIGIIATFLFALVPFSSLASRVWIALTQPGAMVMVDDGNGGMYYADYYGGSFSNALAWLLPLGAVALALIAAIMVVAVSARRNAAKAAQATAVAAQAPYAPAPIAPDPLLASPVVPPVHTPTSDSTDDGTPSDEAGEDDYAQWREQHAQTQKDRDAFLVGQQNDEAATERARAERAAQRGAFLTQMSARRAERRASNPRASIGYNIGIVGLALAAACLVALVRLNSGTIEALALGAFSGAIVLGLGMVVAGAIRRRSGFLALATVAALVIGGAATAATRPTTLVWDNASIYAGYMSEANQPYGWLTVFTDPYQNSRTPLVITKGEGYTQIYVSAGVNLTLEADIAEGNGYVSVQSELVSGEYTYEEVSPYDAVDGKNLYGVDVLTYSGSVASETQEITVHQASGSIEIIVLRYWPDDGEPEAINPDITIRK